VPPNKDGFTTTTSDPPKTSLAPLNKVSYTTITHDPPKPSLAPGPVAPGAVGYVEGFSYIWVAMTFVLSLSLLASSIARILVLEITRYWQFNVDSLTHVTGPMSVLSFFWSIMQRPKDNSHAYMALLYVQAFLVGVLPDLLELIFIHPEKDWEGKSGIDSLWFQRLKSTTRIISTCVVFALGLFIRKESTSLLNPKEFSRFLTDSIFFAGAQCFSLLTFLILDPIRCWIESGVNSELAAKDCTRTVVSQGR